MKHHVHTTSRILRSFMRDNPIKEKERKKIKERGRRMESRYEYVVPGP